MKTAYWLNTLWARLCRREGLAFERSFHRVRETQAAVLGEILRANSASEFGLRHGFSQIRDASEFQRRVPIHSFSDLAPSIDRLAAGETGLLTAEPVLLFEPTSGSTSGEKLIPYTANLRGQFQRAIAAWIWDVMSRMPGVRNGRAYWSISPAGIERRATSGGLTIGFASDAEYLGGCQQRLVGRLLVTPPAIARLDSIDDFRYATLAYLLAATDLSLISIWSPTFLTALLAPLEECWPRICRDLQHGELSVRPSEAVGSLAWSSNALRARQLESIFRESDPMWQKLARCWPNLALVSCWADAAATVYADQLRAILPHVPIQPKGLLATEGVVSIPRVGGAGAALAVRSHFFEFEEVQENAGRGGCAIRLADELRPKSTYRVILTTGGGLYRYRLDDEIQVVGFEGQCPLVRFVGRTDCVDLVGEKLTPRQAEQALARATEHIGMRPTFSLLAPVHGPGPRYRLFVEYQASDADLVDRLRDQVESELANNVYYKQAVDLGQLQPLEVVALNGPPGSAWTVYEGRCLARNQKAGDIKPRLLDGSEDWSEQFATLIQCRGS